MATTKINGSQISGTAGQPEASEVVKVDSSRDLLVGSGYGIRNLTASAGISASYFTGEGSGLTGISSDSVDVSDSDANTAFRFVGVAASGDGVSLVCDDDNAFTFNPSTQATNLPGAADLAGKLTVVGVSDLDGGIDVNASKFTVSAAGAVVADSTVSGAAGTFDALAGTSLALQSGGITAAGAIAGATTIDASGDLTVGSITNAEFTVDASGNTDIDGTLNVEGVPTFQAQSVHSAGATFNSAGLAACGAIAGATTIDASGDLTVGSITNSNFSVSSAGAVSGALGLSGLSLDIEKGAAIDGDLVAASASFSTLYGAGAAQLASTLLVEGASTLEGAITPTGAGDEVLDPAADSLYFRDADGRMKRDTWSDVLVSTVDGSMTNGVHTNSGQLMLSWGRDTYTSASISAANSQTNATMSLTSRPVNGPDGASALGQGAAVYFNGQLLRSGSHGDLNDYYFSAHSTLNLLRAVDNDDVVEILYLAR